MNQQRRRNYQVDRKQTQEVDSQSITQTKPSSVSPRDGWSPRTHARLLGDMLATDSGEKIE